MYAQQVRPNRALSASVFSAQDPYRCFIDTDKRVYGPCKVELTFDRKFVCDQITATFTGEAKVQWTDKQKILFDLTEIVEANGVSLHRNQRRSLFKQEKTIWTAQSTTRARSSTLNDILRMSSSNRIRSGTMINDENIPDFRGFEAGRYKLPVDFKIPEEDIFTSIEVDEELIQCFHGRYPKNFDRIIHVIAPRDLNSEPENLGKPSTSEHIVDTKHGKLIAKLHLPKTGYTPGEPLNARVTVHNKTSQSIKYASVYIVKQITAISEKPVRDIKTREDETNGSILPFHKIQRGEKQEWQTTLHVPALTPNFCIDGFMQIDYLAKLSVGFERGARKSTVLHISIPIIIGTVAIDPSQAGAVPVKNPLIEVPSDEGSQSRLYPSLADDFPAPRTSLPSAPPLYEEATGHIPAYSTVDDDPLPYKSIGQQ